MNKHYGFTLLELMIVVVVIGILAAIAFPYYGESIVKAGRKDGAAALTSLQMAMEKVRGSCALYPNALSTVDSCAGRTVAYDAASPEGRYTIAITSATGNAFTLTATGTAASGQDDDTTCSTMTLTVNNSSPNGVGTPAACW